MSDEVMMKSEESRISNQNVKELIHQARDMYKTMVRETESTLTYSYGFKRTFLEESIVFTLDELKKYTDEQIQELYNRYYEGSEEDRRATIEDMREDLEQAKRMSNAVFQSKQEYEDIEKTYGEMLDDQWRERNSKKNRDKMLSDLEKMKADAEKVADEKEKAAILHKIEVMEATISLEFVLSRIATLTEAEHDRVMKQFFNENEGAYTMERCSSRIKKFGYEKDWYKFFFNLEEKYLPEEYGVFNNLFLFGSMRFISYADPYNKEDQAYVRALLNSLTGLIYNKFEDEVNEKIVKVIEAYDDYYKADAEYFNENNTTHPNHPVRVQYSRKREADRKEALVKAMQSMKIAVPENLEMSADELQKYYNDKVEEMIKSNTSNEESRGESETTVAEDGTVFITPSFNKDKYRNPVDCIDGKFYYYGPGPGVTKDTDLLSYEGDSFFKVYQTLKASGVTNCRDMLELKNPDVPTSWESKEDLQPEEMELILKEAKENIWYFLRFCTNGEFHLSCLGYAAIQAYLQKSHTLISAPRFSGRAASVLYPITWNIIFDDVVTTIDCIHYDRASAIVETLQTGIDPIIISNPDVLYRIGKKQIRIVSVEDYQKEEERPDVAVFENANHIPSITTLLKKGSVFREKSWNIISTQITKNEEDDARFEVLKEAIDPVIVSLDDESAYDPTTYEKYRRDHEIALICTEDPIYLAPFVDIKSFVDIKTEEKDGSVENADEDSTEQISNAADMETEDTEDLMEEDSNEEPVTVERTPAQEAAIDAITKKIETDGLRSVDAFLNGEESIDLTKN